MTNKITMTIEGIDIPEGYTNKAEYRCAGAGDMVFEHGKFRKAVFTDTEECLCLTPEQPKQKKVAIIKSVSDGGGYSCECSVIKEFDSIEEALKYFLGNGFAMISEHPNFGKWRKADNIYSYASYSIEVRE